MKNIEKYIIVILSIIAVVAIGTAVYFGVQLQDKKQGIKKQDKVEKKEDILEDVPDDLSDELYSKVSKLSESYIIASQFPNKIENFNNLAYFIYRTEGINFVHDKYSFSLKDYKDAYGKYFDADKFSVNEIVDPCHKEAIYKLDMESEMYKYNDGYTKHLMETLFCPQDLDYYVEVYIVDSNIDNNVIKFSVNLLYNTDDGYFYSSIDDLADKKYLYKDEVLDDDGMTEGQIDAVYEKVEEKLPVTNFFFKKASYGEWVLKEVTIEK